MRLKPVINKPTLGVEEELKVVSLITGALVNVDERLWARIREKVGQSATPEYKKGQVELRTGVHTEIDDLRTELAALRHRVNAILAEEGLALMASSTHPSADWRRAEARDGERYRWIERQKGDAVNRLLVSGFHTHFGTFTDDATRVDRIARFRPLLPLLIAASTASPFYDGRYTGFRGYRRQIQTGLSCQTPPSFESAEAYHRHMADLKAMAVIQAETDVWGDIRLGTLGKPTVEVRCMEASACVDDGPAMAALIQAAELDIRLKSPPRPKLREGDMARDEIAAWQAARCGASAVIWDHDLAEPATVAEVADRLIEKLGDAIELLGVRPWIDHFRWMLHGGTSAERMLAVAGLGPDAIAGPITPEMADRVIRSEVAKTAEGPSVRWPPTHFQAHLAA
ncbi:hypothetical protein DDF62_14425 [Caulobacter radicis]|uniref:carboxylate-amine ligase n=1 Tax=Caulobacter radicis TaxID=2172650 RepID=UPI000D56FE18|nr:YbdK family carboxylate-amine ligase [Caulobacter radicis]PVM88390.1 hypothetical protein DDF62_14425 [Caulobacter radicis]